MKNRHHLISVILLLLVVPFILSCGIPNEASYCDISYLKLQQLTLKDTESDVARFGVRLYGKDSETWTKIMNNASKVEDGPSLLLFYVLYDSTFNSSQRSDAVSLINSKLSGSNVASLDKDKAFATASDSSYSVYPFYGLNSYTSSTDLPSYPFYNFDINGSQIISTLQGIVNKGDYSNVWSWDLSNELVVRASSNSGLEDSKKGTRLEVSIDINESGNSGNTNYIYLQNSTTPTQDYAYVFGVIFPGYGTFKVPSHTTPYYLGCVKLNKD